MSKIVLKPCPFCGGEAVLDETTPDRFAAVFCGNCAISTTYSDRNTVISAWNRRANQPSPAPAQIVAERDELARMLRSTVCYGCDRRIGDERPHSYTCVSCKSKREFLSALSAVANHPSRTTAVVDHETGNVTGNPVAFEIRALEEEATPPSPAPEGSPYVFDRYVDGVLMAEGVQIDNASSLDQAMAKAAKIVPSRMGTVLVYRPAPPSPAPEGWVTVPREPAREMLRAALLELLTEEEAKACYRSMISAAPAAPDGWQPTHRHKKRGTTYRVEGLASLQAAEPCEETAVLVFAMARMAPLHCSQICRAHRNTALRRPAMSESTMQDHAINDLIGALCCVDDWCTPAGTAIEVARVFEDRLNQKDREALVALLKGALEIVRTARRA